MVSVQYLKHNITKHATTIILIFIIFLIYRGDFVAWWKEATISDWANYVLLVPAISLFSIYRKRRELKAVLAVPRGGWFSSLIGLSLCLQAFILNAYGSHTLSSLFFHMLSLAILTTGLVILVYGFRVFRSIMFPLLFLFFAAPPPIGPLLNISSPLTDATARLSILVVRAMGIPASLDRSAEAIIVDGSETFILRLGFQCSGIYSLLGFIVFVTFAAYWLKGSPRRKLLLSSLGFPLMFLINVLRVVIIIAVGYFINSGLALQIFHWLGGTVLIFIGTLVMLFVSEKILGLHIPQPTNIQTKSCSACPTWKNQRENFCLNCGRLLSKPKGVYRKRFFINMGFLALICFLFLSITIPVFALDSHVAISLVSPTKEQIESLMPKVKGWKLTYINRDTHYEKIMSEDLVLLYSYTSSAGGPEGLSSALVFLEISSFQPHMIEGWTVCTPNVGWAVEKYNAFIISKKPPLVGWSIVLRNLRSSTAMSILCWHQNVYINTPDGPVHKMLGVSVFSYVKPCSESVGHEGVFEVFSFLGGKIFDHWQYVRLDQTIPAVIGLTINQFLLSSPKAFIVSMAAMAPLGIALSEMAKMKKWITAKKIASYMSDRHRMLINIIIAIKAERKSVTLEALLNKYNEQRPGEGTDPIELYKTLIDLESRGVVERNHEVTGEKVAITWGTPLKVVYKP